jgi:hypothetical protein
VNVSGVGATPPPPPLPAVAPAARAAAASDTRTPSRTIGQRADRQPAQPGPHSGVPEVPPLRVLTVTEMRLMLGQLPASAAAKLAQRHADPSAAS